MASEIEEHDNMFSVREVPWHGLGDVLNEAPTVEEARKKYLNWTVALTPAQTTYKDPGTGQDEILSIPSKFAIVREDTKTVIGSVGKRYIPYQNFQMWDFVEQFQKATNCTLETAGSLRNGETTWILAKGMEWEVVSGDVIDEFFLIKNGFNGETPISQLTTNIRVVCANTLSFAMNTASNIYNVRHVKSVEQYMLQVQKALGVRAKYQEELKLAMSTLVGKSMVEASIKNVLENNIFRIEGQLSQTVGSSVPVTGVADDFVASPSELSKRSLKIREQRIGAVLELVEKGAGADIPGVRGTGYGVFQALLEWHDHLRTTRPGSRDPLEVKFENAIITGIDFKRKALYALLKAA